MCAAAINIRSGGACASPRSGRAGRGGQERDLPGYQARAKLQSTSPPGDQSVAAGGGAWAEPAPPNTPSRALLQFLSIQVPEHSSGTFPTSSAGVRDGSARFRRSSCSVDLYCCCYFVARRSSSPPPLLRILSCWTTTRGIYIWVDFHQPPARSGQLLLSEGCTAAGGGRCCERGGGSARAAGGAAAAGSRSLTRRGSSARRGLWSVRVPAGYKVKSACPLFFFLFFLPFLELTHLAVLRRIVLPPEARGLTMGDSVWRYYFGVLFIAFKADLCRAVILESIYWNTTNTKFVPGQGVVLYPQIGDKLDIVCPRVDGGVGDGVEYYKVYMVPREQLESCTITKADTPLLHCVKPDQDVKFTLKFQEFSPNLWGLEFFRGKDYYIISTSNGTLEGIDNQEGGVCKTKSMKIIMKVEQNPSDPISPKDYPTRVPYSPKHPDGKDTHKTNDVLEKSGPAQRESSDENNPGGNSSSVISSEAAIFVGIASGSVIFIIIIIMLVLLLLKYRRRHRKHSPQHAATLSLSTLATPKRSGGGGNNNGSEPSDIIIPLRTADSVFCPHYEKVSGDYGHPVYIVQEMPPQSPANIYYKV